MPPAKSDAVLEIAWKEMKQVVSVGGANTYLWRHKMLISHVFYNTLSDKEKAGLRMNFTWNKYNW